MFSKSVYVSRRQALLSKLSGTTDGIAIFVGNSEAPANYRGNDYHFRQDSSFLYFWGIDAPDFAAILDLNTGAETVYGNDVDVEDIIWMGPQESVASIAAGIGAGASAPLADFAEAVRRALSEGRKVHFLPPARYAATLTLCRLTGSDETSVRTVAPERRGFASEALVKAVVSLRLIKEACEIEEIDKACEIGCLMHETSRKFCRVGTPEQEIVGRMEGVTISKGWGPSFPTILSQHGETLHNHRHDAIITPGHLLVVDAGAESNSHYASDFTRTYPTGGKFTARQREIYDIVQRCNDHAFSLCRPGISYRDVHLDTTRVLLEGLKEVGLVKGDVDEMVPAGIAGLFMPHGLGHNMGLDVHDMEDLGEDYVGYAEGQKRGSYLGLANLRMARVLEPGHVITDEPGIYFIPALIAQWKREGLGKGFVNFEALEKDYLDFGGIRLEDDVLITPDGARRLGSRRLPILSSDVEAAMAADLLG